MNYTDAYLKFATEDEANAVLHETYPLTLDDELNVIETYTVPRYQNIDVLGTLYAKPPADAPEDYQPVPLDGWHVNVRVMEGEDRTALEPFQVNPAPTTPARVWG